MTLRIQTALGYRLASFEGPARGLNGERLLRVTLIGVWPGHARSVCIRPERVHPEDRGKVEEN